MSMEAIPKGPEDIPLRGYVKEHFLIILIHDLANDKILREETINYSEPDARRWLGRITHWATTNGHSVETINKTDYDKYLKDR